jgi:acetylornithine/N-succinyldiaminopimelate aminotransferase
LMENARIVGNYAMEQFKSVEGIKEIRGLGLMIGLEFHFPVAALRKRLAFDEKCFVGSSSEANTIRLLPPLCITKEEIDILVASLKRAVAKELVAA